MGPDLEAPVLRRAPEMLSDVSAKVAALTRAFSRARPVDRKAAPDWDEE